jgi:DNA-binding protein HU-beta
MKQKKKLPIEKSAIVSKKILVERITNNLKKNKIQLDKSKLETVISDLLEEIKKSLVKGEKISFPGYLSLYTVISKPRIAMDLRTKKKINVPAKRVPKAKFSSIFKEEIAMKKK